MSTQTHRLQHAQSRPTVRAALLVFVAYGLVVVTIQATSGIDYDQWFDSVENALRAPFAAFLAGAVLLLAFLAWARWDGIWREPVRLPMGFLPWAAVGIYLAMIALRFAGDDWSGEAAGLIAIIFLVGLMVGFCEELLFRGILLRAFRATDRGEAVAFVATALLFGAFHLVNVLLGQSLADTLLQVVVVTFIGIALYLLRRGTGLLAVGIVVHGLWDSTLEFVPEEGQGNIGSALSQFLLLPFWPLVIVAAGLLIYRDSQAHAAQTGR